ncbi:MAG: hypothetical protein ACUVUD_04455 [bacterium]
MAKLITIKKEVILKERLFIALIVLGMVTFTIAQWRITGYITTETEPVQVDSVSFLYGSNETWFLTPGWEANPGETTEFRFPEFAGWPAVIKYSTSVAGMPVYDSIYRPVSDSWYSFPPPQDMIKIMFHGQTGIEENSPMLIPGSAMLTNLLTDPRRVILNSSGMVVRSLPLAPGIYFYRSADKPHTMRRFLFIH